MMRVQRGVMFHTKYSVLIFCARASQTFVLQPSFKKIFYATFDG